MITHPFQTLWARGRATARSAVGAVVCTAILGATFAVATPAQARNNWRKQQCDACGTVVTTNRKDVQGGQVAGTIVGGVGGAVAGNMIGHDTAATVIGGVGGAVAGNVIERKLTRKKVWSVQVRMDRGDVQDVDFRTDPRFQQGDRVRIVDGTLRRL